MSTKTPSKEGFTVGLAVVDAIPVLLFCASMILVGTKYPQPLFLVGAIAMAIGGISKVAWKFVLGLGGGDKQILAKLFRPCMFGGFALLVVSIIYGSITGLIDWGWLGNAIISMPSLVFFVLAIVGFFAMGYLGKKMDQTQAKWNWIEQFTNVFAQLMLFLGILNIG